MLSQANSAFPWLHPWNLKVNIIFTDDEVGVVITHPSTPRVVTACMPRGIHKLNSIKITRIMRMFCVYF